MGANQRVSGVDRKADRAEEPDRSSKGLAQCHSASRLGLRVRLFFFIALVDVIAIVCGILFASLVRFGVFLHSASTELLAALVPVYAVVAFSRGAFSTQALRSPFHSSTKAVESLAIAAIATLGIIFYLKSGDQFSRITTGVGTIISLGFIGIQRFWIGNVIGRLWNWKFTNDVLLVDEVDMPLDPAKALISAKTEDIRPTADDPDLLHRIGHLLEHSDRVILACPPERREAWAATLKGLGTAIEIYSPELTAMGAIGIGSTRGTKTVVVDLGPLKLKDRILKRSLDLAVSVLSLPLLLPLFAIVALAIKIDSPGPVFFRQPRVGQANRIFSIWKFRTMQVDGEDKTGRNHTLVGDKRITRIGRFLRSTSLDEIPQILNVIEGTMSLVGPRPHPVSVHAEGLMFWEVDPRYWHRHAIKPGITGLAQVRGHRGSTLHRRDVLNRVSSDLEYLAGWTLWRDLIILVATFRVVVHDKAF